MQELPSVDYILKMIELQYVSRTLVHHLFSSIARLSFFSVTLR